MKYSVKYHKCDSKKKRKKRFENQVGKDFISYKDNVFDMEVLTDGSGYINIDDIDFHMWEGMHKDRIKELERIRSVVNKVLKTLNQIEDPNIYFPEVSK